MSTSNHLVQCTPQTFRHNQVNDGMGRFLHCANKESIASFHFFGCHEFQPIKEYYTEKVFNNYFQYNPSTSNIPYMSLFTDKNVYKIGENVEIFLKNTGSKPLVFTILDSRLEIRNLGTGESFLLNMPVPFVPVSWRNQYHYMESTQYRRTASQFWKLCCNNFGTK